MDANSTAVGRLQTKLGAAVLIHAVAGASSGLAVFESGR
jgi:hypothetical protein